MSLRFSYLKEGIALHVVAECTIFIIFILYENSINSKKS